MTRFGVLLGVLFLALAGCSGGGSGSASGSGSSGTSMAGTWTVTGTGSCSGSSCGYDLGTGSGTYTVILSASPCTVSSPLGSFSVSGSTCFIANNYATNGSISGTYSNPGYGPITLAKKSGVGLLVGVPSNPVPDNSTVNLVFVSTVYGAAFAEFTGTGTIAGGKLSGTGTCSTASPICKGATASFTATLQ